MNKPEEVHKRKPTRAPNFNYNSNGGYFLTICTLNREHIFGRIVGIDDLGDPSSFRDDSVVMCFPNGNKCTKSPVIELSKCGRIVEDNIIETAKHYPEITVDKYVVMPNHIHILLRIDDINYPLNTAPRGHAQTNKVSKFVTALKKFSNRQIGENIWQSHFHDHIIRTEEDYLKHWQYIEENPMKWLLLEDEYQTV